MEKEYDFYCGKKIIMDDRFFKLTTDTVLLSSFVRARPGERGIDLGCGIGCLGLLCELRRPGVTVDGVEITPGAADLAQRNYGNCGGKGEIFTGDIAVFSPGRAYAFAVFNPPYFAGTGGKKSASGPIAAARHADASLFFGAASRCVAPGGRVYFCMRYGLLSGALEKAAAAGLYLNRARFVCEREGANFTTALCEAGFLKTDAVYEKPLVLRDGAGYTEEYKEIYGIR
ncbi:MAG: methyltransferase [Clostridia bacterium]|nr:methyltransferase [Clostridia bacterium]